MAATKKTKHEVKVSASLSSGAHALAAVGKNTGEVVQRLCDEQNLLITLEEEALNKLAEAFKRGEWRDDEAAKIVTEFAAKINTRDRLDLSAVSRWVFSHPNDADAVLECLSIVPPEEISIIRRLSKAGSQKLVFLATWRLTQREVVLKYVKGPPDVQNIIIERESQSHPLSMKHPNIVETHFLKNATNIRFLVEERIPVVLSDTWRSDGIQEAANLLYDIAKAINYLHSRGFVHGDVKPDNIGKKAEDYILLDFGICRPTEAFTPDITATGSLRTRAPELFCADKYEHPEKVDLWALGATVYNAMMGRFPLFQVNEAPPRVSHPPERNEFEQLLKGRVVEQYDAFVKVGDVPEPIRAILEKLLARSPGERPTALAIIKEAESILAPFLRRPSDVGQFSPLDEIRQLTTYLPKGNALTFMPRTEKEALLARLNELAKTPGLEEHQIMEVKDIIIHLS